MAFIGEIFSLSEADAKFGKVNQSYNIEKSVIRELFTNTKSYLMFSILNNEMMILGDNRTPLYPDGLKVNEELVFSLCSIEKIIELLDSDNEKSVSVELREEKLTISGRFRTLEDLWPCPPYCGKN